MLLLMLAGLELMLPAQISAESVRMVLLMGSKEGRLLLTDGDEV
jgi:hypothetical protein